MNFKMLVKYGETEGYKSGKVQIMVISFIFIKYELRQL